MIKLVLAAAAMLITAAPALAHSNNYQPTAQDFRDGTCTRQQVHIPAGKIVHAPPIVRCDQAVLASRDAAARDSASAVNASTAMEAGAAR